MEVHKHPHHVNHSKKWTEYLLEFLMIFLAVFLGFIAENYREEIVERSRVRVLAFSLITDLQKDTSQINFLEKARLDRGQRLDSFYNLLHTPFEQIEKPVFFKLLRKIYAYYTFSRSSGTIDQLKNAGYLRYFSDSELLKQLADYEFIIQDYKADEKIGQVWYDKFIEFTINNLDPDIIDNIMQKNIFPDGYGIKPLISNNLNNLKAIVVIQRGNNKIMKGHNESLKKKAIEIIRYLSSKYH
ncbi:MAG: hypothetical protein NVS9B7_01530 [Flavisolibacter sp.]